jgi:hypothetical protein
LDFSKFHLVRFLVLWCFWFHCVSCSSGVGDL